MPSADELPSSSSTFWLSPSVLHTSFIYYSSMFQMWLSEIKQLAFIQSMWALLLLKLKLPFVQLRVSSQCMRWLTMKWSDWRLTFEEGIEQEILVKSPPWGPWLLEIVEKIIFFIIKIWRLYFRILKAQDRHENGNGTRILSCGLYIAIKILSV